MVKKVFLEEHLETEGIASEYWEIIRDFYSIDKFHPAIEECIELGNNERKLIIKTGNYVIEKMLKLDDILMNMEYIIVDTDMPIDKYSGKMSVREDENNSVNLIWNCELAPKGIAEDDLAKMMKGFFQAGLKGMDKLVRT